ncbi:MAG: PAS domain S-box protein [Polyangiaceae bacterium]|nr:PAS domain S-box protein [Polyangiaceae bacterium]
MNAVRPSVDILQAEVARLRGELRSLRESQGRLQLLIDITNTGWLVLDERGRVLDASPEGVRLTGHESLDQICGRTVSEWTAPHHVARNEHALAACLEIGFVRNLEIDCVDRAGRVTPLEINAAVHRTAASTVILTICRDITERRRASGALGTAEMRYSTTIDAMPEAIHVVDEDLRIMLMNRSGLRWARQLELANEPLGRSIFEVYPFLSESVRAEYELVFARGDPLMTEERNTLHGTEIVTETRKIPVVQGGKVTEVVTVVRDITELTRAQQRLRQSEKMQALGQLAGGIAHDFNNQLAAMLGYAELLSQHLDDGKLRGYAEAIVGAAARSAELTRHLLTFSRQSPLNKVPVDVHTVLREVVSLLSRTIDKRVMIALTLSATYATTLGDHAQLFHAFLNLALNARDAMTAGGVLSFTSDVLVIDELAKALFSPELEPGAYLQVRVTDTGAGMTEETKRRIFEPFFTTKPPGRGTGLGLASAYGTVVNHQGAIHVESEVGKGSSFAVLLPLSARLADAQTAPSPVFSPGRGAHVLVVDDDAAVLDIVASALRHLGYNVTTCRDGIQALRLYREGWRAFDLVLLDWMMPELSGPETLRAMRAHNPQIKAIMASEAARGKGAQQDSACVATDFVQKPFRLSELSAKVAAVLAL